MGPTGVTKPGKPHTKGPKPTGVTKPGKPHTKGPRPTGPQSNGTRGPKPTGVTKRPSGVTRTLKTRVTRPATKGPSSGGGCAFTKITATLLLEHVSVKRLASRLCGRFRQTFKYVLLAEIRKYQRIGLRSVEITDITVEGKDNLLVEFDVYVNPNYHTLVRNALRQAVVSVNLKRIFKY